MFDVGPLEPAPLRTTLTGAACRRSRPRPPWVGRSFLKLPPAVLAFGILAATLSGPALGTAVDRDVKFANGLVERDFFDLAEVEFRRISNASGTSPEARNAARLGIARVIKAAASRETVVKDALVKFSEAEAEFRLFLKDRSDPLYFTAAFELGSLLQDRANATSKAIEEDVDLQGISSETARDESIRSLEEAQNLFDDLVAYLKAQPSLTPQQADNLERSLYLQATNYYFMGLLHPKSTFERESNFKRSADKLEDFIWEYESRPSALWALMFKGKAHFQISLENDSVPALNEALDSFAGAEAIGDNPDSLQLLQDIYEWSILEAATSLNAWQRHVEAIEKVDTMNTAFQRIGPNFAPGGRGWLARLEKARALQSLGDVENALDTARKVAEEAPIASVVRMANNLIKTLLGGTDVSGLDPKVLLAGGEAYYASRDFLQAIQRFRQALVAWSLQDPEKQDPKIAVSAWSRLGDSLRRLGRNFESGLAFKAGRDRFSDPFDVYKDNAFRAYSSFQAFAKKADEKDRAVAQTFADEAKNFLLANFQNEIGDIIYFEAKDDFDEGNYREAKDKFFRVDVNTRYYETSQLYIGRCEIEEGLKAIKEKEGQITPAARGRIESGLKVFADYKEWTKTYVAADPARALTRKQALAAAEYYESEAQLTLGNPDAVLSILEGFQTRWADQQNLIPSAIFNRIRAYEKKGDLDSASEWSDYLFANYEKSDSTLAALLLIGQAIGREEAKAVEAGNETAAAEARSKSASYLLKWFKASGARPEDALTVGKKFYDLGDFEQAASIFQDTYDRHKKNTEFKNSGKLFQLTLLLARSYLELQKYHEAEPLFEEVSKEKGDTLDLLVGKARCYGGWIVEKDGQLQEFDGTGKYSEAMKIYTRFASTSEANTDTWWLGKFGQIYMVYKFGQSESNPRKIQEATKAIDNLKLLNQPPYGPPELDRIFKWLDTAVRK